MAWSWCPNDKVWTKDKQSLEYQLQVLVSSRCTWHEFKIWWVLTNKKKTLSQTDHVLLMQWTVLTVKAIPVNIPPGAHRIAKQSNFLAHRERWGQDLLEWLCVEIKFVSWASVYIYSTVVIPLKLSLIWCTDSKVWRRGKDSYTLTRTSWSNTVNSNISVFTAIYQCMCSYGTVGRWITWHALIQ